MLEIRSKNCCKSYPETLCMYAEENTDSLLDLWHCRCCNKKKISDIFPFKCKFVIRVCSGLISCLNNYMQYTTGNKSYGALKEYNLSF